MFAAICVYDPVARCDAILFKNPHWNATVAYFETKTKIEIAIREREWVRGWERECGDLKMFTNRHICCSRRKKNGGWEMAAGARDKDRVVWFYLKVWATLLFPLWATDAHIDLILAYLSCKSPFLPCITLNVYTVILASTLAARNECLSASRSMHSWSAIQLTLHKTTELDQTINSS